MPFKDPAAKRAYAKRYNAAYYQKNKSTVKAATARTKAKHRDAWREFKSSLSCVACGVSHADLLDFHHLPQYRKDPEKISVNKLVGNYRFARAYEEVKKCVVLCANCHRLGHQFERKGLPESPSGLFLSIAQYFVIPSVSTSGSTSGE